MSERFTLSKFVENAIKKHGDRYDYSLCEYLGKDVPVLIECAEHGIFKQSPNHHTRGSGCPKCAVIYRANNRRRSIGEFIEKSISVHGCLYDYSMVDYVACDEKVKIICTHHGIFEQTPSMHFSGSGCPICARKSNGIRCRYDTELFIEKANLVHGDKYDYSMVVYSTSSNKVVIGCPDHGYFEQIPASHLMGLGCTGCGNQHNMFKKKDWIEKSKDKIGTFYIIRCFNETESFYKYGITYNGVSHRYLNKLSMPYEYEIIRAIISTDKEYIWHLEKRFGAFKKKNRYNPHISFKGCKYECFSDYTATHDPNKFY